MAEQEGTVVMGARGTVGYLAPELCALRLQPRVSHVVARSGDMWSLGVVAYALLCGQHPWLHAHLLDPLYMHYAAHGPTVHLWRHVPPALAATLASLLCPDPQRRAAADEASQLLGCAWDRDVPVLRARMSGPPDTVDPAEYV